MSGSRHGNRMGILSTATSLLLLCTEQACAAAGENTKMTTRRQVKATGAFWMIAEDYSLRRVDGDLLKAFADLNGCGQSPYLSTAADGFTEWWGSLFQFDWGPGLNKATTLAR